MIRRGTEGAEMPAGTGLSSLSSMLLLATLYKLTLLLTNRSPRPTTKCVAANPQRWPSPSPSTVLGFWLAVSLTPCWTPTTNLPPQFPPHHTVEALIPKMIPKMNPLSHNSQWFQFPCLTLDWYRYWLDHNCERISLGFFPSYYFCPHSHF